MVLRNNHNFGVDGGYDSYGMGVLYGVQEAS